MHNNIKKPIQLDYQLNRENNDDKNCTLKFSQCDDKYPLWDLRKDELKAFIKFSKMVENLPWRKIKMHSGLKFENLPGISKPDNISQDVTMSSMRVSKKFRLIGYRQEENFYIVWFDNNHKEC